MNLSIAVESPLTPDGRRLVAGSQDALLTVLAPDEIFTMTAEELDRPGLTFYVARDAQGRALGCVARQDAQDYVEVKRLFVPSEGRGKGVARALMARLEADARARGCYRVLLETAEALVPAVRLYETLGYVRRGPFGDYADHPASLFMEKRL
jgi:putative acetyltransferase